MIGVGELRQDFLGSWCGEAALSPNHRITLMYVQKAGRDSVPLADVTAAVRAAVDRISQNELAYRTLAARAWLGTFHEECPATREWNEERLAGAFVLKGLILGDTDSTIIVEHDVLGLDLDKILKTWFNPDGTLSHISGHLY
jgi:hypothetical protein